MMLHLLTRRDILLEPTTGADKSAMGAVNRPLRRSLAYTYLIHLVSSGPLDKLEYMFYSIIEAMPISFHGGTW